MKDLISRADAIEAVHKYFIKEIYKTPHEIDEDGDDVYTDMTTVNSLLVCNKELSKALKALPSADAVSEDTQTEERARFVAKETELAHIEAKLENAEKRLQGACVANFVAEQLDRLRNMTDEEKWEFFKRFFEMEGGDE